MCHVGKLLYLKNYGISFERREAFEDSIQNFNKFFTF